MLGVFTQILPLNVYVHHGLLKIHNQPSKNKWSEGKEGKGEI